jgi:DNA mismatch repair ATPase MutL
VKLDSSILKRLIKEELQNLLSEEEKRWSNAETMRKRNERKALAAKKAEATETTTNTTKTTETPTTTNTTKTTETPTEEVPSKKEDKKGTKKSTFTREQERLRRKINQLKKDGKIDKKTHRAARNALYKGTGAANAVLQKAGVGGRSAEGTRTAGGEGRFRRAQQPLTPQEHATTKRLYNAVKELQAVRHPQLQNIWLAIVRAANGGHRVAAAVINHIQKEEQERRQVTQATQTRDPMLRGA